MMEEDGGTSTEFQGAAATVLMATGNPYTHGAGVVLGALTKLGFFLTDSDDYIGSFGVQITNNNDSISVDWKPTDPLMREFRFNGDNSNYVGWFQVREAPKVPVLSPPKKIPKPDPKHPLQ